MKTIPAGKGWFVWQIKRVYGGNAALIAAHAKAQGISWIAIKINDGKSDYNKRPLSIPGFYADDLIQPLVDACNELGIDVYGWGYIYLANAAAEAAKAIERTLKFGLKGFIVDAEKEWVGKFVPAAAFMKALRAGLENISIGMCSYRFVTNHNDFPWAEALKEADYHCPQVYWVEAHNAAAQLAHSFQELTAKKNMPYIPVGYAYKDEVTGTMPTQGEIIEFDAKAKELHLRGEAWYSWDDALNNAPQLEGYVGGVDWGETPIPDPVPRLQPIQGKINFDVALGLRVRQSPINGSTIGKLERNTHFEGDTSQVAVDGHLWLHITSPIEGWIASWFTTFTDIGAGHPVTEKAPAIPGPYTLPSDGEITGDQTKAFDDRFPNAGLDAYPATVVMEETWLENGVLKFGKGSILYSDSWLARLKKKMTERQWNWFWNENAGIHNGTDKVKMVTTAYNKVWVKSADDDHVYIQCYHNDEPAPDLRTIDPYRIHYVTVMHRTLNHITGGIFYPDAGKVPYPVLSGAKSHTLRIAKEHVRPLVYLPLAVRVKSSGDHLNVRDIPSTSGAILARLKNGTEITIYELTKVGDEIWGRYTESGSAPGWVAMWFTNWAV